ncbi:hypothetical protein ACKUV4_009335 [Acinetobacter baumannii]
MRVSINWYSASINSESLNESFLFCAIGMESLLTTGRDSITKVLAENTAFLIAKDDIESRKLVYNTMCNLYAKGFWGEKKNLKKKSKNKKKTT